MSIMSLNLAEKHGFLINEKQKMTLATAAYSEMTCAGLVKAKLSIKQGKMASLRN